MGTPALWGGLANHLVQSREELIERDVVSGSGPEHKTDGHASGATAAGSLETRPTPTALSDAADVEATMRRRNTTSPARSAKSQTSTRRTGRTDEPPAPTPSPARTAMENTSPTIPHVRCATTLPARSDNAERSEGFGGILWTKLPFLDQYQSFWALPLHLIPRHPGSPYFTPFHPTRFWYQSEIRWKGVR